jgi:hypothetical protein
MAHRNSLDWNGCNFIRSLVLFTFLTKVNIPTYMLGAGLLEGYSYSFVIRTEGCNKED